MTKNVTKKRYQLVKLIEGEEFLPTNSTVVEWSEYQKAYFDDKGNGFSRREVEDSGNWKPI